MEVITVRTVHNEIPRNVTIAYDHSGRLPWLMGTLAHGTEIVVDQELVDALQQLVIMLAIDNKEA